MAFPRVLPWISTVTTLTTAIATSAGVGWAQPVPPAVSTLLPSDVTGVVLVNTTDPAWATLGQYQLFNLLDQTFGIELRPNGLDFIPALVNQDDLVRSWIGPYAATVVMPPTTDTTDTLAEQVVTIAPIADTAPFIEFRESLISLVAETMPPELSLPSVETYQGVTLLIWSQWVPTEMMKTWPPSHLPPSDLPPSEPDPSLSQSEVNPTLSAQSKDAHMTPTTPDLAEPDAPSPPLEPPAASESTVDPADPLTPELGEEPQTPPIPGGMELVPGFTVAELPGAIVFAQSPEPIRQLIAAQTGLQPLATTGAFQRTIAADQFERSLVIGYVNLATLAQFDQLGFENLVPATPPLPGTLPFPMAPTATLGQSLDVIATVMDTVEIFVTPTPAGLQYQSRIHLRLPQIGLAQFSGVDEVYEHLPGNTLALTSGLDLAAQWQISQAFLQSEPTTAAGLEQLRAEVTAATGLDFDQDIIRWMDGEFSFFLLPSENPVANLVWPGIDLAAGLVIQTSDRPAAERAVDAIGNWVQEFEISINRETIESQPVITWQSPALPGGLGRQDVLSYGWLDDEFLAVTTGTTAMRRLLAPATSPLATAYPFTALDRTFPQPNQGYAFVNMGATLAVIYQALPAAWKSGGEFAIAQQFMGSIHSLGFTASSTEHYIQLDGLLGLAPTRHLTAPPAPTPADSPAPMGTEYSAPAPVSNSL